MITGNNIEDYIKRDGVYVTKTEGISMLPFIRQGHATVIVVPVRERLKKYDVALFHRKTGEYVLHRVVKVRKNDYVFCGDNQKTWEYGITDELIVGVMSELYDDGVKINIDGEKYKKAVKKLVKRSARTCRMLRLKHFLLEFTLVRRVWDFLKHKRNG